MVFYLDLMLGYYGEKKPKRWEEELCPVFSGVSPKGTVSHRAAGLVIIWFCPGREGFIRPFKC